MEKAKNLKAYIFTDNQTGYDEIEWFETAGQAKRYFANENTLDFCDVRVYRVPWADKYQSQGEVPSEDLLAHGWWIECHQCGRDVTEENLGEINGKDVYCNECRPRGGRGMRNYDN